MAKDITVSDHAIDRAKERLSWNEATLTRMLKRAMIAGIKKPDTSGRLRKFLDSKCIPHKSTAVVHGEVAYFIRGNYLATVYQIPSDLVRLVKKQKRVKVTPVKVHGEFVPDSLFRRIAGTLVQRIFEMVQMPVTSVSTLREEVKEKL